jgi:hypothetical protein
MSVKKENKKYTKTRIYALNSHKTSLSPKCTGADKMQLNAKKRLRIKQTGNPKPRA